MKKFRIKLTVLTEPTVLGYHSTHTIPVGTKQQGKGSGSDSDINFLASVGLYYHLILRKQSVPRQFFLSSVRMSWAHLDVKYLLAYKKSLTATITKPKGMLFKSQIYKNVSCTIFA